MKNERGNRYRKIGSAVVAFTLSCSQVSCSQRSYPSRVALNARATRLPRTSTSDSDQRSYPSHAALYTRTKGLPRTSTSDDHRYRRRGSDGSRKQQSDQAHVYNQPYRHSAETDYVEPEDAGTDTGANLSISRLISPDSGEGREQFDQSFDASDTEVNPANPSTEDHRGNPVIYRYFGRSRARSVKSESIPFIVLGSKVDHWKSVGRILASRGFNVMACEQVLTESKSGYYGGGGDVSDKDLTALDEHQRQIDDSSDGEALIIAVLDALKWNKAVLVGCDRDAVLAIEAALRLAPDRIAGLVLCGDLTHVEDHIGKQILSMQQSGEFDDEENLTIGSFLRDYVDCPCTVISDGDAFLWPTDTNGGADALSMNEKIIGGGLSPHRQLPEQFAWTLSRFVENRVSEQSPPVDFEVSMLHDGQYQRSGGRVEFRGGSTMTMPEQTRQRNVWQDKLPPEIEQMLGNIFSSGSLIVSGRAIASAVIYLSLAKVGLVQYKNFRKIHFSYLRLSSWGNRVVQLSSIMKIFSRQIPVLISRSDGKKIPDSLEVDICDSEVTLDGSEQDNDSPPNAELYDPNAKNGFDENKRRDTEMDDDAPVNFFTLEQVVS